MTPELDRWLDERLARERQAMLDLVFKIVERLLSEQRKLDAVVLKQGFERLQDILDRMPSRLEEFIDRKRRGEPPVEETKLN